MSLKVKFLNLSIALLWLYSNSFNIKTFRPKPSFGKNEGKDSGLGKGLFLDLDDILENDVSFLQNLRTQIETPLPASSKEITNRIKGFFSGFRRSPKEVEVFSSYIQNNKNLLDIAGAILIYDGCDKLGLNHRDIISESSLLQAMSRPSPLLSSSIVYRAINHLKKLDPESESTKKYLKFLWEQIKSSDVLLQLQDVSPSIYSILNYSTRVPEIRKIIQLLARSVAASEENLPSKVISSALYGMRKMRSNVPEVRELLGEIAKKIVDSEAYYHSVNVCIALNGLQLMDDGVPEVRAVLAALMDKAIPAHEQGLDRAGDREISMALFGLQRMGDQRSLQHQLRNQQQQQQQQQKDPRSQYRNRFPAAPSEAVESAPSRNKASAEVKRVVAYITTLLEHHTSPFEAKRLGFALCGLACMSHEIPEVQKLVSALAKKSSNCWGDVTGHELSMCLHGLSSMQSESKPVRELLKGLVPLVHNCPSMETKDIVSALSGLQGMRTSSSEVCALIGELSDLLKRSNTTVSDLQDAGNVIYGLQGLSSAAPETRRLLVRISPLLAVTRPSDDGRAIATLVGGLKSFSSRQREVRAVLRAVTPLVESFRGSLSPSHVAIALYGLQELRSGHPEVTSLVAALTPLVAETKGTFNPKGLSMALNGLQGLNSTEPEVRSLVSAVTVIAERSLQETPAFAFEDFHQLSAALAGFSGMTSDSDEVQKLLAVVSKIAMANTRPVLKWQPGQGGVKTERVAMALFGLRGMNWTAAPVREIMTILADSVKRAIVPDAKSLGLMLQGFSSCSGYPPEETRPLLTNLSLKMRGWSRRALLAAPSQETASDATRDALTASVREGVREAPLDPEVCQEALRNGLLGISKISRMSTPVQSIFKNLASETVSWDFDMDAATKQIIAEVCRGEILKKLPEVAALLERTNPSSGQASQGKGRSGEQGRIKAKAEIAADSQQSPVAVTSVLDSIIKRVVSDHPPHSFLGLGEAAEEEELDSSRVREAQSVVAGMAEESLRSYLSQSPKGARKKPGVGVTGKDRVGVAGLATADTGSTYSDAKDGL